MIYTVWGLAITVAMIGGWIDFRSRRLPNWLTVSGFFIGIGVNAAFWGWPGAKGALLGAGIPLLVLLPVVLLQGLGGGDWKLMAALGAILGRKEIYHVLLATIFVAGAIALVQMIWQKRFWITLKNLWELVRGFFVFGLKPHPDINLNNAAASTLPFGVAAAAATLLCWGAIMTGIFTI
jgi:prepilin peptidase CpaA